MTIRPVIFFIFEQKVGHGHDSNVSDAVRHLLGLCTEAALNIQEIIRELSEHKIIGEHDTRPYLRLDSSVQLKIFRSSSPFRCGRTVRQRSGAYPRGYYPSLEPVLGR